MAKSKRKKRESQSRVSDKISVLRHEGTPERQAVATALSMERSGRLKSGGRYIHKRRGRRNRRA